jgi:2-polyprenyl-3-methyl-5-hydroxy-6-metoxy-1,4-benzoquinol methylase
MAGFEATAIEMDARSAEVIAALMPIEVLNTADEASALGQTQPADVIAMWQVIEHLVDPWTMLEAAANRLKPGGVLILAAPNPDSLQFKLFRQLWVHVDAPRHLWLIPIRVVLARASVLGLQPRLITTRDPGSRAWTAFGWEHSLRNLFPSARLSLIRRAARLASMLAMPIEAREGMGATYTIALQKPWK